MRDRWVDIALIGALVLVAGTIVYTLFGRPAAPPPSPQAGTAPEVSVEPVAPNSQNESAPETIAPISPEQAETAPQTTQEADITTVEPETQQAEDVAVEEETPQAPLPEGTVNLERIGFSYVTGGVGACNIVLEPWEHIAVSLDLREQYPCGTEVTITFDEEVAGRTSFKAIIADGIRNAERTVNVYVGTDEPALEYGLKDGTLSP